MSEAHDSSLDKKFLTERIGILIGDEPKDFAFQVGISISGAYNYRNGCMPTLEILFRIAQVYGRPLGWFLRSKEGAETTPLLHERRLEDVPSRQAAVA